MGKVLIVSATRAGETDKIADLIAEGIRISGHEVVIKKVNEIKNEDELNGYDGYVFGSATYHGEMIPSMKQFLFIAERADLNGKPVRIYETMENIYQMKMVSDALRLKASSIGGGVQAAQDYGKSIAALI